MPRFKIAAVVVTALVGSSAMAVSASAMPAAGLTRAATPQASNVQNVRWVCGPYRCFWAPGYGWWGPRPYPYWGPGRWGWRGGWHGRRWR